MKPPKNLLLLDGNAIIHRAYHALPPLTNQKGQLTNAVYGFFSMLFSLLESFKPSHLIVCFDRPEPTFRKQLFAGYQAHRPKMENELAVQLEMAKALVKKMAIPVFEVAGYEADDIIGTLAAQSTVPVVIVTGDRDILQLVNAKVRVYMPQGSLSQGRLFDDAAVLEKYGVRPEQIVDYKALVGDNSDNYPGVAGVGPKTAASLLQEFGSLEKIYAVILDKKQALKYPRLLKERLVKVLASEVDKAGMAKKLARIVDDVPVTLDLAKAEAKDFANAEAVAAFEDLGFRSLVKRLQKKAVPEKPLPVVKKAPPVEPQLPLL